MSYYPLYYQIDSGLNLAKAPVIMTSASGSVASFPDGAADLPLQSLKVAIDPVQDLHGYDKPWPAGGGKNLLDAPDITLEEAGTLYSGPVNLPAGTYTLSSSNTTVSVTVGEDSGVMPLTFTLAESIEEIEITASDAGTFNNLQIEAGSSATTYAPYSNICPITGYTGVTVTRTGKNLIHNDLTTGTVNGVTYTKNADGSISLSGTASTDTSIYIFGVGSTPERQEKIHLQNASIVLSGCPSGGSGSTYRMATYFFKNGEYITGLSDAGNVSVINNITADKAYAAIIIKSGTDMTGKTFYPQLELGSTATDYEPYQGSTYPITFPQSAGTVYGGELTINQDGTGKLVVDSAMIASYDGETLPGQWISDRDVYEAGTTPTTGAQVVYKLATPITFALSAPQVRTLLGVNNIWADTGDTEATYRADTKLYIEQLTKPDEYDMIADSNITSGKFFMVGNRLFLSTAAIEQGAAIVPGTNCTEMSLADALNTINI